jgi:hypothetical protein
MKLNVLVVRREAGKAVQLIVKERTAFVWLPKSMIGFEVYPGMRDFEIEIPDWLWRDRMEEVG